MSTLREIASVIPMISAAIAIIIVGCLSVILTDPSKIRPPYGDETDKETQ